jgi:DNA polymerase III sliding clamp (beta) subunit (PCNA family)
MKINRKEFLDKLKELYVATDTEPLLNSDCFIFDQNKIFTSTIMLMAQTDFDNDIQCAVKAKKLVDIISHCPTDEIQLDFQENKLRVVSGKFKSTVNYTEYEAEPKPLSPKFTEVSDGLLNALKSCAAITSSTSNFLDDTGALIHVTDKYIEASDTYQILYYQLDIDTKDSVISGKLLSPILKFYWTHYQFTKSVLVIKTNNDVIFSLSLNQKKYEPYVQQLLEKETKKNAQELSNIDTMIDAINRAALFAVKADNTQNKLIKIQIVPNKFVFSGLNFSVGSAIEYVKVKHSLPDTEFTTSPIYLINGLKEATHIKIKDNYIVLFGENSKRIISI